MTDTMHRSRPFNTPLECGLRMLFALNAAKGQAFDLHRLVSYDYLLVHSGDVGHGPPSLHPAVPFRGGELLVKRDVVQAGLDAMFSRELLVKTFEPRGIYYHASELTNEFLKLLVSTYSVALRARAQWVVKEFEAYRDDDLQKFMQENLGRWGAEFEHITAIKELEL